MFFLLIHIVSANRNFIDLLKCYFLTNSQDNCQWAVDQNDWGRFRWRIEQLSKFDDGKKPNNYGLCLHRVRSLSSNELLVSRLWSPSVGLGDDEKVLMDFSHRPRCISLHYRFYINNVLSNRKGKQPSISMLKRQRG